MEKSNHQPSTILLVEDNVYDIELFMHAFEDGLNTEKIDIARDGAEALDYIYAEGNYKKRNIKELPRIILLDLKLPKVDGLEVLERLKTDSRSKSVPVIVLTTSSEESDIRQAYELGANSYIVKPVNFDHFAETINEIKKYWFSMNKYPPQ